MAAADDLPRIYILNDTHKIFYEELEKAITELNTVPVSQNLLDESQSIIISKQSTKSKFLDKKYPRECLSKTLANSNNWVGKVSSTSEIPHNVLGQSSVLCTLLKRRNELTDIRLGIQLASNYLLSPFPEDSQFYNMASNDRKRQRDIVPNEIGIQMQFMACVYFITSKLLSEYQSVPGLSIETSLQQAVRVFFGKSIKNIQTIEDARYPNFYYKLIYYMNQLRLIKSKSESNDTRINAIFSKTSAVSEIMPSRIAKLELFTTQDIFPISIKLICLKTLGTILKSEFMSFELHRLTRFVAKYRKVSNIVSVSFLCKTTPIHIQATINAVQKLHNTSFPFHISMDSSNTCYLTTTDEFIWKIRTTFMSKIYTTTLDPISRTHPLYASLSSMYFKSVQDFLGSAPNYVLNEISNLRIRTFYCTMVSWLFSSSNSSDDIMTVDDPYFLIYTKLHLILSRYHLSCDIVKSVASGKLCDALLGFVYFNRDHWITSKALFFIRDLFIYSDHAPQLCKRYEAVYLFIVQSGAFFTQENANKVVHLQFADNLSRCTDSEDFSILNHTPIADLTKQLVFELYTLCSHPLDNPYDKDAQFLFENILLDNQLSTTHPSTRSTYTGEFSVPDPSPQTKFDLDVEVHEPHIFTRIMALIEWRSSLIPQERNNKVILRKGLIDIEPDYILNTGFCMFFDPFTNSNVSPDESLFLLSNNHANRSDNCTPSQYWQNILLTNESKLYSSVIYYATDAWKDDSFTSNRCITKSENYLRNQRQQLRLSKVDLSIYAPMSAEERTRLRNEAREKRSLFKQTFSPIFTSYAEVEEFSQRANTLNLRHSCT